MQTYFEQIFFTSLYIEISNSNTKSTQNYFKFCTTTNTKELCVYFKTLLTNCTKIQFSLNPPQNHSQRSSFHSFNATHVTRTFRLILDHGIAKSKLHAFSTGKVAARRVHVARTTPVDWASRRATAPGFSPSCSHALVPSFSSSYSLSSIHCFWPPLTRPLLFLFDRFCAIIYLWPFIHVFYFCGRKYEFSRLHSLVRVCLRSETLLRAHYFSYYFSLSLSICKINFNFNWNIVRSESLF